MSSNPSIYTDYWVDTIKQQSRVTYGYMAAGLRPWVRVWAAAKSERKLALSVTHSAYQEAYAAYGAI